jgi:ATP:ADP antiporter, AAA family
MLISILRLWVGDTNKQEIKKFFFLAFIFLFTIGVYWFLRTSKDGVFNTIVGFDWQPFAKWLSMGFVIPLSMTYGALVDRFPKHRVFYALSAIYSVLAVVFAFLLDSPSIGLQNAVANPARLVGWGYYIFIESFGSLMPILFWTFAADTTNPEPAKRWFPFLSFTAQFGALFGSMVNSGRLGVMPITKTLMFCSLAILMIGVMMYLFMSVIPTEQLSSYESSTSTSNKDEKKKGVGFIEGFKLVFSQTYLLGIFFSIMIYEVISTLFDFKFKSLLGDKVADYVRVNNIPIAQVGSVKTQMFNEWVGWMGEWVAIVAILSYLLGISRVGRRLGVKLSLMAMPVLLGGISVLLGSSKSILIACVAVIVSRAINYVFYQPTKEQLYIPTSKDAKYKSKAFIDSFGSRTSKAAGSLINSVKFYFPAIFPLISMGSSVVLCLVWIVISISLGKKYEKAVENNELVC